MKPYLRQLIAAIREARTCIIPPDIELWESVDLDNEAEVEDIAYIEESNGTPEPISVITGIETDLLPFDETITPKEKVLLAQELEALLAHYNLYPDFLKDILMIKNTTTSAISGTKSM